MTTSHVSKIIEDGRFIGAMISRGGLLAVAVLLSVTIAAMSGTLIYTLYHFTDRHTATDQAEYKTEHQGTHAAEWTEHGREVEKIVTAERENMMVIMTTETEMVSSELIWRRLKDWVSFRSIFLLR